MTDASTRTMHLADRRGRWRMIVALVVSFAALALGVYSVWRIQDQAKTRTDKAVTSAEQLCQQVQQLGGTCSVDVSKLRGDAGPAGPAGPGPTDEQVKAAVDAYFVAHPPQPGRPPTASEIALAVINYLTANPPAQGAQGPQGERGPGPTAEQIADAVRDYLIANPPPAGPQGPGPTAEQIADAVAAYVQAHPLPVCADGYEAQAHTVLTVDAGSVDTLICVKVS